jgi:thiosulfate dehydrogenase [quinone] large subunit
MSQTTYPASAPAAFVASPAITLQNTLIFVLRVSLGWVFLWAAIRQFSDPKFTAAQFLAGAKTFTGFYGFFLQPEILPIVNVLVKTGHLLIGLSLIAGVSVRLSSAFGALLMMLYYFPRMEFPYVSGVNQLIVEYHLVYALVLLYLGAIGAGRIVGLETWIAKFEPFASRPKLRAWLS